MTQETTKLPENQIIELCDRTNKEIAQKFDENGLKISTDGTRLIRADGKHNSYVIPEGIIAICRKAFNGCKNVNEIILPSSLRYIGEYAFEATSSLKQIIFPNSVEYIGKGAFKYSGIKKVNLSKIMVNVIKEETFYGCRKLKDVKMPENLFSIGNYAFYGISCKVFEIPNTVMYIGNVAISSDYLKDITLPESLTELGYSPFGESYYHPKIKNNAKDFIYEDGMFMNKEKTILYFCCIKNKEIVIPKSIEIIRPYCFCYSILISIAFEKGSNLKEIGERAFAGYADTYFDDVIFPKKLEIIGKEAFCNSGIYASLLPEGLKFIGERAFAECPYLFEISLPNSIEKIGLNVFEGCTSLRSIDVKEGQAKSLKKLLNIDPRSRLVKEKVFNMSEVQEYIKKEYGDEDEEYEDEYDTDDSDIYDDEFIDTDEYDTNDYQEEEIDKNHELIIEHGINWKKYGITLKSQNMVVDSSTHISIYMEIMGKLKEHFSLYVAVFDMNNKICDSHIVENFFSDYAKFKGKFDTIVTCNISLPIHYNYISKIKFYI